MLSLGHFVSRLLTSLTRRSRPCFQLVVLDSISLLQWVTLSFGLESSNQVNRSGRQLVLPRQYTPTSSFWQSSPLLLTGCLANILLSGSLVTTSKYPACWSFPGMVPDRSWATQARKVEVGRAASMVARREAPFLLFCLSFERSSRTDSWLSPFLALTSWQREAL